MTSEYSLSDIIITMNLVNKYLYQIGSPILMVIGTISFTINLLVFTQKNLRKNPCSIYFIAININNFLIIYIALLNLTVDAGFSIDPSIHSMHICRLRLYATNLLYILNASYLILASIDRILVTSSNARTRERSTHCLAYICVISGTLFWSLFHIHALFFASIMQFGPDYFLCYYQQGVYLTFISYYVIIKEISVVSLMIIFGLWTIKNIRSRRLIATAPNISLAKTTSTVGNNLNSTHSKDRQMTLMLLVDTTNYAVFSCVFAIFLMYQQITQDYIKSFEQIEIETYVRNLCLFIIHIPICNSCYTNLIVSKTFRSQVKKLFSRR